MERESFIEQQKAQATQSTGLNARISSFVRGCMDTVTKCKEKFETWSGRAPPVGEDENTLVTALFILTLGE